MALIHCCKCGKKISDQATECVHCGCALERVICPECGTSVVKGSSICSGCGYPLKKKEMGLKEKQKGKISISSYRKVSNRYTWMIVTIPWIVIVVLWTIWYLSQSFLAGICAGVVLFLLLHFTFVTEDMKILRSRRVALKKMDLLKRWKWMIPGYLYQRFRILNRGKRYIIGWGLGFGFLVMILSFQWNPLFLIDFSIQQVKRGTLYSCPDYTLEELVDHYVTNPEWSKEKDDHGDRFVNMNGKISMFKQDVNILIQYKITTDEFLFHDLKINGVSQPDSVYDGLVHDMCGSKLHQNQSESMDTKEIIQIDFDTYKKLYNGFEKSIVYFGQSSCTQCVEYEAILKEILSEYDITIYYINIQELTPEQLAAIQMTFSLTETPSTVVIQNGDVLDYVNGWVPKNDVIEFLKTNDFIASQI